MIIDKNNEGAWRISDIINGYWQTKVYYFYTKKDAIKLFRKFRKGLKNVDLAIAALQYIL